MMKVLLKKVIQAVKPRFLGKVKVFLFHFNIITESPEQNINRVNWTNRKDKFYSHNRNFNKSKLYTPKISGRQSDNNTSVSRIGKLSDNLLENKRLNLTERAQKSFIEERSKNLNKLFKGNGALGGIMQTILRKSTIIGKQDM